MVRAGATTRGPLKRDASTRQFSNPLSLNINIKSTNHSFCLQFKMETPVILSSPLQKDKGEWPTPTRAIIRSLQRQGKSQREIVSETTVPRRTVRRILKQEHSRRVRGKKQPKLHLMSIRDIRQCIRTIAKNWSSRRMSFADLKAQLNLVPSVRTIHRELRRAGYRRCIACPRPYISRIQAKKRLAFAMEHRWWGTSDYAAHRDDGRHGGDWRKVIWSDEAIFETRRNGRIWVTRRVDERRCPDCIRSIYRSGRVTVMIWGAIS